MALDNMANVRLIQNDSVSKNLTVCSLTLGSLALGRNNNFDMIRFVAASMVVFSHSFNVATGNGDTEPLGMFSHGQIWFGHLAVYIFFIISGFLIAQSYERSRNIIVFFWARFLRIYPGFIASLLFAVVVGAFTTTLQIRDYISNQQTVDYLKWNSLFVIQFTLPGVFGQLPFKDAVNGALWSIPHEVACYVLVACFGMLGLIKRKIPIALIAAAFFYLRIYADAVPYVHGFRMIQGEAKIFIDLAAFFFIGTLFYVFSNRIVLDTTCAMFSIFAIFSSLMFGGFRECFAIAGSYLIFYVAFHPSIKFWSFAKRGDLSYGIYVYAFPIQQFMVWHTDGKITPIKDFLYSYPIILVCAFLSWHLLEKQALKFKRSVDFGWLDRLSCNVATRVNSIQLVQTGLANLKWLCFRMRWVNFGVAMSCLMFFTFKTGEKPTFISFPNLQIEALLHGGWLPQSPDEHYRWISQNASVDLASPKDAKAIIVEGYVPDTFTEITNVKTFIDDMLVGTTEIQPGKPLSLSLSIPISASSRPSVKVGLMFNGVHLPANGALDQRHLSALINKIAID